MKNLLVKFIPKPNNKFSGFLERTNFSRIINNDVSWLVEVRCTEDYQREPYYTFEVMMPKEFLDQDLFMKLNTGEL